MLEEQIHSHTRERRIPAVLRQESCRCHKKYHTFTIQALQSLYALYESMINRLQYNRLLLVTVSVTNLMNEYIYIYIYIYTHTHTHTHTHTGAGHIIRISSKSWFISLIPFKKWNYNVYIHSTQTDIFQVFISFNFDDYKWQLMKTPNSVSQKIRILLKTNTKKGFLEILANWKVWTWKVWACTALNT